MIEIISNLLLENAVNLSRKTVNAGMKRYEKQGMILAYEVTGALLLRWFGYLNVPRTIFTGANLKYRRDLGKITMKSLTTSF